MRYASCTMKVWILTAFLLACSGPSDKGPKTPEPLAKAVAVADAGTPTEQPKAAVEAKLTEAECDAFFSRIFEMAAEAQRKSLPPEKHPTAADIETAKAEKRGEMVPQCMKLTKKQLNYDCFMAATDLAAVSACEGG